MDRVRHDKFGTGTVLRDDLTGDDPKLEIEFEEHGRKLVLARFVRTLEGRPWMFSTSEPLKIGGIEVSGLVPLESGVHRTVVDAREAFDKWRALTALAPKTGLWPVIIDAEEMDAQRGQDGELAAMRRRGEPAIGMPCLVYADDSPEEALELASGLTFSDVLAARCSDADDLRNQDSAAGLSPRLDFSTLDGRFADMALVPTDAPWKVPAYLPRAGGNDCPARAELAAFLRHFERYRPILAVILYQIEIHVGRPPNTLDEARSVAVEHLMFCDQLLDDERISLDSYAQHLLESTCWYLAWD